MPPIDGRQPDRAWGYPPPAGAEGRGAPKDRPWWRSGFVPVSLAIGLVLVAAVYAALSVYMALTLTRPDRLPFEHSPEQYGLAYESVVFPSRIDALQMDGWLLPAAGPAKRPVVMVHGKGSDRQREAGGRALEIAQALVRDGHTVLMFDLRGSGRSGGERFTLGGQEVRDVGGAVDFLAGRGLAPDGVTLLGFSMGASTSMLLAASEPGVTAVVDDSGYAELGDVLEDQVPKASGLPGFFTPGVVLGARLMTGVDAYTIRPVESVRVLAARGVPLLVIHGEADTTVPVAHGRRLAGAYGPRAESYFVPGAGHVRSYQANPATYLSRLLTFLNSSE